MKEIKRIVNTGFWDDDMVLNDFSPEDKYFMLYLLTNTYTSQLGIYHLPIKKASFEMGYTEDTVRVLLDRFENKYGIIKFSKETSEVAIKNYLRHSIIKGGKPVMDCLLKEETQVQDKSLLPYIYNHLSKYNNINNTVLDYLEHLKVYINNNNDNENERIVDESWTYRKNTTKSRSAAFIPPTVEEVDLYLKSVGSQVDAESFVNFYESKGWMVGKNKMKSWKSAIVTWEKRDNLKRIPPKQPEEPQSRFSCIPKGFYEELKSKGAIDDEDCLHYGNITKDELKRLEEYGVSL